MKLSKKLASIVAAALLSVSTYVAANTEIICWSVTCQTCTSGEGCSDPWEAPDSICLVDGVSCPG